MPTNDLLLRTHLQWEDVVLPATTAQPIQEILTWLKTSPSDRGQVFGQHSHAGYQALFDGEEDEIKTSTAALIGKVTGMEVIRLRLSDFVAEEPEKTEKNLASIFELATQRNYILYIEEVAAQIDEIAVEGALVDKFIQYLIEFPGLTIISSSSKAALPKELAKNLQTVVNFG